MDIDKKMFNQLRERSRSGLNLLLPSEEVVGEPFWCIMEMCGKQLTGSYYAYKENKEIIMPIFSDKDSAIKFFSMMNKVDQKNNAIRGISKEHNKFIEQFLEDAKIKVYYAGLNDKNEIEGYVIRLKELNKIIANH